ncbi:hypothetical protein OHA10_19190 [Kribbella sp. NBC_00662]|uniref:hypothetical protein n=1 Tax=Kribbella sp. NBC_00662 TaxID=2975969 RepID=UPI0032518DFD
MHDDHDASGARLPYQLRADTPDHFVILDFEEWKLIATAFGGVPQLLDADADETVVRRLVERGVLEQVDRRGVERGPVGRRSRGFSREDTPLEAVAGLGGEQPAAVPPAPVPSPGPPAGYAGVPTDNPGHRTPDPEDERWAPGYDSEEPETPPAPWALADPPAEPTPAATAEDDRRRALEDLLRILSR